MKQVLSFCWISVLLLPCSFCFPLAARGGIFAMKNFKLSHGASKVSNRYSGLFALRSKFEFYEVQQSRQYNIAKIQQGYYVTDADGQVPLENVLAPKFKSSTRAADDMTAIEKDMGLDDFVVLQSGYPKPKYLPSLSANDPIVQAITNKCGARQVLSFHLLDKRWNGNYIMRYATSDGDLFVKLNHEENKSVFVAEAVGLTSLLKSGAVRAPKPLHVGEIHGGEDGRGSFLITEFLELSPFGSMTTTNQRILGEQIARLHTSGNLDDIHKGRFGFMVNNFHSRTPLDNTWSSTWVEFFTRRLTSQLGMLQKEQVSRSCYML